jgi:hypothetical protein
MEVMPRSKAQMFEVDKEAFISLALPIGGSPVKGRC